MSYSGSIDVHRRQLHQRQRARPQQRQIQHRWKRRAGRPPRPPRPAAPAARPAIAAGAMQPDHSAQQSVRWPPGSARRPARPPARQASPRGYPRTVGQHARRQQCKRRKQRHQIMRLLAADEGKRDEHRQHPGQAKTRAAIETDHADDAPAPSTSPARQTTETASAAAGADTTRTAAGGRRTRPCGRRSAPRKSRCGRPRRPPCLPESPTAARSPHPAAPPAPPRRTSGPTSSPGFHHSASTVIGNRFSRMTGPLVSTPMPIAMPSMTKPRRLPSAAAQYAMHAEQHPERQHHVEHDRSGKDDPQQRAHQHQRGLPAQAGMLRPQAACQQNTSAATRRQKTAASPGAATSR